MPSKEELVRRIEELESRVKSLEDYTQMPIAMAYASPQWDEEDETFNVHLISWGKNKILGIKGIREVFRIGLKEAKNAYEAMPNIIVAHGLYREAAIDLISRIKAHGGYAEKRKVE